MGAGDAPLSDRFFVLMDKHAVAWLEILRRWYFVSDGNAVFAWQAVHLVSTMPSIMEYPEWVKDYLAESAAALIGTMQVGEPGTPAMTQALRLTNPRQGIVKKAADLKNLTVFVGQYENAIDDDPARGSAARVREKLRAAWGLQSDKAVQDRLAQGRKIIEQMVLAAGKEASADRVREAAQEAAYLAELTGILEKRLAAERNEPRMS